MASSKDSKYPFWDTSGWFSLIIPSESNHDEAKNIADQLQKSKLPFFTSDLVIQETMTLLMARKETEKAKQFWASLNDSKVIRLERMVGSVVNAREARARPDKTKSPDPA